MQVQESHKHLSPDRWSPTGWKYLPTEAVQSTYLTHANKRNSFPNRTRWDYSLFTEEKRLKSSSRLHYPKLTPDMRMENSAGEGERNFPPLPLDTPRIEKQVHRLSRTMRKKLLTYDLYHEPHPPIRKGTALPGLDTMGNQWAGTRLVTEPNYFHKRKTVLSEWAEQAIVHRYG